MIAVIDVAATSGKTGMVGTLIRVLSDAGLRVAVARLTGIATSNKRHFYARLCNQCGFRLPDTHLMVSQFYRTYAVVW